MEDVKVVFVPDFVERALATNDLGLETLLTINDYSMEDINKDLLDSLSKEDLRFMFRMNMLYVDNILDSRISSGYEVISGTVIANLLNNSFDLDLFKLNTNTNKNDIFNYYSSFNDDSYSFVRRNNIIFVIVKDGFTNIVTSKDNSKQFIIDVNEELFSYFNEDYVKSTVWFKNLLI